MTKILFCTIAIFLLQSFKYKQIEKYKAFTVGRITAGKEGAKGGMYLFYSYKVNGVYYKDQRSGIRVSWKYFRKVENKHFVVFYSQKNPEKSILIASPRDFRQWQIPIPDSMHWVIGFEGY